MKLTKSIRHWLLVVVLEINFALIASANIDANAQLCQHIYKNQSGSEPSAIDQSQSNSLQQLVSRQKTIPLQQLISKPLPVEEPASSDVDYKKYYSTILFALKDRAPEILNILLEFNNQTGNKLEWAQTIKFLKGIESYDLYRLNKIKRIQNAAIMGSTNVPLYTLIAHGLVSASFADHVWFRTPEKTRHIYIKILEQLKLALPAGFLDNFHLITDDKDVSYDVFNRVFVMGLNRNGTRSERAPSELVIFTGNPNTVRGLINRNNKKLKDVAPNYTKVEQTFIGFLAGMNPTVITESAKNNFAKVISQVIEPALINAGQDCMTSDFYLLNQKIAGEFILQLNRKFSNTPLISNTEYKMGISPLFYMKDFTKLKQYRDKYEDYLVNKNARLDIENKIVEPHIFKFPVSMFSEVEIQEHFAPFFSFFTYSDISDVQKILLIPEVQKKTMYATVLGGADMDSEIAGIRQVFRQYGYSTLVNDTIFSDIETNLPFGGVGTDTSLIVNVTGGRSQPFSVKWAHRPTTIINEMYYAYGDQSTEKIASLQSPELAKRQLDELLQSSRSEKSSKIESSKLESSKLEYSKLESSQAQSMNQASEIFPQREKEKMYQHAAKFGVSLALNQPPAKTKKEKDDKEFLYGVSLQHLAIDSRVAKKDEKKLILIRTSVKDGSQLTQKVSKYFSPQNQETTLLSKLSLNKNADYIVAQAIWPGFMPLTESMSDLVAKTKLYSYFHAERMKLIASLNQLANQTEALSEHQQNVIMLEVANFLSDIFKSTRSYFSNGAYFKNFGEFATGDTGTIITSHQSSPRQISMEFVSRFLAARKKWLQFKSVYQMMPKVSNSGQGSLHGSNSADILKNLDFRKFILENNWETNTKFVWALLADYEAIMVQKSEQIAKTELGYNQEYRVDFIDGVPVFARIRFGNEYYWDECEQAKKVFEQFMQKAPLSIQKMSGGADLAKTTDGRWILIEFNFGTASGTLAAEYYPFEFNQMIMELTGKPTALIKMLESDFQSGLAAQRQRIMQAKLEKPKWWKTNINEISKLEYAKWFRDRHIKQFQKNPTAQNAAATIQNVESLLQGIGSDGNRDFEQLLISAKFYFQRHGYQLN